MPLINFAFILSSLLLLYSVCMQFVRVLCAYLPRYHSDDKGQTHLTHRTPFILMLSCQCCSFSSSNILYTGKSKTAGWIKSKYLKCYYDEKINSRFSSHFESICVDCSIGGIFCSNLKRKTIYLNSTFLI